MNQITYKQVQELTEMLIRGAKALRTNEHETRMVLERIKELNEEYGRLEVQRSELQHQYRQVCNDMAYVLPQDEAQMYRYEYQGDFYIIERGHGDEANLFGVQYVVSTTLADWLDDEVVQ